MRIQHLLFCLLCASMLLAKEYTFAIFPSNTPAKITQALTPLMHYLSEQSGDTFQLVITKDYEELAQRIREKSVDFAWVNTKNFVLLKEEIPSLHYLVTYLEHSKNGDITPYYQAFIIAHKPSHIQTLDEAKDKYFAFTDKDSTSGYAYPMLIFQEHNINPYTFFKKIFFLKKHDKVIEALMSHSIEAGAVSDGTYYSAFEKYGDAFTILARSKPIPLDAIVASEHIGAHESERIAHILERLSTHSASTEALKEHLGWDSAGFMRKDSAFYETFKQTLKASTHESLQ
ncbi:phosphate/phosphite/phosphonate ABC transporter substrate-binding protein [Sulfurospirillum barnesii]|uniref:Phosphate/phosphite/phosphonate ABC transporters, periplasmic binding protein n=1 Tax=Sulfurospirillum barnesii (strain ATCC 700032 / DSM 10660 / SES-3) TaxID=760154 RepID=I3XY42_SULBS|nr:phosphate/phosphite/phosphonate ABC transporter substrate-binding protein [Sulfurospirillum barnesii]AFL68866.1 phosphate/phosphite/phosphonate ABC transporters, periplasmic binding protein [Sulfurospirillum barnesii SES-3]